MKLKDFQTNKIIFLGSYSQFVFVGSQKKLMEQINILDKELEKNYQTMQETAKRTLGHKETLSQKGKIYYWQNVMNNKYVPLLEREIVSIHQRYRSNELVVKVEGYEIGFLKGERQ